MRFSLKQLEYFLTVTETKSITLAAKQLNISSPSISTAITQLEKEFSLQLFVRKHATGLFLTPGGEKFAKATKLILQQSKDLYDLASNITNYASGPITLGCLSTLAPIIVPQLRRSYITKNPNVIINQIEGNQLELIELLLNGKIDVALTYDLSIPNNISFSSLLNIPPHVLLPIDHKFSKCKEIELKKLVNEPMVLLDLPLSREYFLELFSVKNLKPYIKERSSQISVVRSLVAHNFGYSIANFQLGIPQSIEGIKLSQVPIKGEHKPLKLGIAKIDNEFESTNVQNFIKFCKNYFK